MILKAILAILTVALGLYWWNSFPRPYERPPAYTDDEKKACYAEKPERDSSLISTTRGVYWTMKNGKKKWCVRREPR